MLNVQLIIQALNPPTVPTDFSLTSKQDSFEWNIFYNNETSRFVTDTEISFDESKTSNELPKNAYELNGSELQEWLDFIKDYNDASYKFDSNLSKTRCIAIRGFSSPDYGGTLWYSQNCNKFHVYCNGRWYAYSPDALIPSYGPTGLSVMWNLETACGTYHWYGSYYN